jgi:hypothetical protein
LKKQWRYIDSSRQQRLRAASSKQNGHGSARGWGYQKWPHRPRDTSTVRQSKEAGTLRENVQGRWQTSGTPEKLKGLQMSVMQEKQRKWQIEWQHGRNSG